MTTGNTKNRRQTDGAERHALRAGVAFKAIFAVAVTAGLLLGGKAALRWASTSPSFRVRTISFHGLARATEPELLRLSGLAPGLNLFALDPEQLAQAMAAHPWVRRVDVARHFPRALSVQVVEHEPTAMVSLNELYLLDSEGEPFKKVTPEDAAQGSLNVPLVTGLSRDQYMQDPQGTLARFRTALAVLKACEAHPAFKGERISEVRLEKDGVGIVSGDGQDVVLGSDERLEEKLDRLARVRSELSRRGLAAAGIRLDNRTRPGWVTVQLENTAALGTGGAKHK